MRNTHGVSQCLNRKSRASNNQSFHSFPTKRIGRTRSQWLHSRFMFCLINAQTSLPKRSNVWMCKRNPGSMWITCYPHVGGCKNPEPFQMVFPALSFFFPLVVFPSAGFTPWSKNSHERGQGKGKGIVKEGKGKNRKGRGKRKRKEKERERKGKRKEKERKTKGKGTEKERKKERQKKRKTTGKRKGEGKGRVKEETGKRKGKGEEKGKKGNVSHGPFLVPKAIISLSFGYRSWILRVFLFIWQSKRNVATTYQAPSLCRICAIMTTNTERKRPKAINSRRMMDTSRTLDFKSLDTDH